MKTKKYHTPRKELMTSEPQNYIPNHPQIQKFYRKYGTNYLHFLTNPTHDVVSRIDGSKTRQTKPIQHSLKLLSLDNYDGSIPFKEGQDKTAEIYTQGKPNPYLKTDSKKSPFLLGHCEGSKPLRETDNLEDMFIGSLK